MVFGISAIVLFITLLLFQNSSRWKSLLISCCLSLIVFEIVHSYDKNIGKGEYDTLGHYMISVENLPLTDMAGIGYYLVQIIISNAIVFGLLSLLFNKRIISKNGNEKYAILFILVFLVSFIVTDAAHAFLWAFGVTFFYTIISSIAYPNEWTKPKEYFVTKEPLKNEEPSVVENIKSETTQVTIDENVDLHAKWRSQNISSEKSNNGFIQKPEEAKEDFSKHENRATAEEGSAVDDNSNEISYNISKDINTMTKERITAIITLVGATLGGLFFLGLFFKKEELDGPAILGFLIALLACISAILYVIWTNFGRKEYTEREKLSEEVKILEKKLERKILLEKLNSQDR